MEAGDRRRVRIAGPASSRVVRVAGGHAPFADEPQRCAELIRIAS